MNVELKAAFVLRRKLHLIAATVLFCGKATAVCTTPFCGAVLPQTPATASISRNNLGSISMRLELRLHGQNWAAAANVNPILNVGGLALQFLGGSGLPNAVFFRGPDTASTGNCHVRVPGATDVLIRISRDLIDKQMKLEIYDTATGVSYASFGSSGPDNKSCVVPITAVASSSSIRSEGISLGNANATGGISFMRWYSSTVRVGTPIPIADIPGNLGNWNFEQSGVDNSGSGQNLSGMNGYVSTPTHTPVCSAGTTQIVRVNDTLHLSGLGSVPLDGSKTLQYSWTVLSSPASASVVMTGAATATPTVMGLTAFGTYHFQLTVTDGSNQTAMCSVKNGAVVTAVDNIIDLTAEGLSETAKQILGPQTKWGSSPWPWADDRQKASLDLQRLNLQTTYAPYWRTPLDGTVTVTAGSTEIVGSGGTDLTAPCGGGTSPLDDNTYFILIYSGTDGQTHYTAPRVTGCTDSTHLNVAWATGGSPAYPSGTPLVPLPNCTEGCSGLGWQWGTGATGHGVQSNYGVWIYNPAPANFYDNVKAFYGMYYRTGIDDYLDAAHEMAEAWWEFPALDQGYSCYTFEKINSVCWPFRSLSATGMVLRALEEGPASPKWAGLRLIWERSMFLLNYQASQGGSLDLRETGYMLAFTSYCGMADPDEVQRETCKAALAASLGTIWTPLRQASLGGSWGYYYSWGGVGTSTTAYSMGGSGSVCVMNGSKTVTGQGTNWSPSFNQTFWTFDPPATRLPDNSTGDDTYYRATVNSPTTLTLDRPYEGHSQCDRGFSFGSNDLVAWAVQPWMLGHLGQAFALAADALEGYNTEAQELFRNYLHFTVQWVMTNGYNPVTGGLYNAAYMPGCIPPISSNNVSCFPAGADQSYTRVIAAEVMRALSIDYTLTADPAVSGFADLLMTQMFSKPGTGGPASDNFYLAPYDDGGYYMIGAPPIGTAQKWTGVLCGYTEGCSIWPAVRNPAYSLIAPSVRGKVRATGQGTIR